MNILHLLITITIILFLTWLATFPLGRKLVTKEKYHIPAGEEELRNMRDREWIFPSFATAFTITTTSSMITVGVHPGLAILLVASLMSALGAVKILFIQGMFIPSEEHRTLSMAQVLKETLLKEGFLELFVHSNVGLKESLHCWYSNLVFVAGLRQFFERSLEEADSRNTELYMDIRENLRFIKEHLKDDLRRDRYSNDPETQHMAIEATLVFLVSLEDLEEDQWKDLLKCLPPLDQNVEEIEEGMMKYLAPTVKVAVNAYLLGQQNPPTKDAVA